MGHFADDFLSNYLEESSKKLEAGFMEKFRAFVIEKLGPEVDSRNTITVEKVSTEEYILRISGPDADAIGKVIR
jgi:hypothetical protein